MTADPNRGFCRLILSLLVAATACQSKDRATASTESSSTAASLASHDTSTTRGKILFVGTSLTAGLGLDPDSAYSYMIQRKIDSVGLPFETVNAGVSGETTAGLLERLDWLLKASFDIIVIESGANDGLRGVAAGAMEKNLDEIVRRAKTSHPDALILLIQMEALPNYGRQYGSAFHDAYADVARREQIPLLPFLLDGVAGHPELNQSDGVHPNLRGERIVAENVWRGLEPRLRQRALTRAH
jgi:acyl-CoA thioesterase I